MTNSDYYFIWVYIVKLTAKGIGLIHNKSNNVWIIEYIARVGQKGWTDLYKDINKNVMQGKLIRVAYTLRTYWNQFSQGGICKQE